jgi:hypothetical protein
MYYFSGIDRAGFIEILAREGAAGMVNATVATQPAMKAAYRRYPEVPLVLDSGAFQGVDDLEWYASVIHEVGDRFEWCASLDVIGDQSGSDRNWRRLHQEMDCNPLWIYQVEGGASLKRLENEMDKSLIGIGGLVPVIKRSVDEAMYLIKAIGQILQPWSKAHFFGVSSARILAEFGREPWFASADSQSWLSGMKARELFTRDGRRIRCDDLGLELSREECAKQNIRQIHTWMSGEPIQFSLLEDL